LRNGNWKKIPNNTLAEGDIIKLLPDDKAPALIGVINQSENDETNPQQNFNQTMQSNATIIGQG